MVKKIVSKEDDLRNRVYKFVDLNPDMKKCAIVKHFMLEGVARSTLYDILQRKTNKISYERKVGSGRPVIKMSKLKVKRLKQRIDHRDGISQTKLAKVFDVSHQYISKIIRTKTGIRYRKKIRVPNRSEQQKSAVRPKCRRLVDIFRKKEVILDDESYFGLSNCQLSENVGYYSSDISQTPDHVKLNRVDKFQKKLLVWIAISSKGISNPYVISSGQAINETVYIENCLNARLVPFIETFHKNDEIVFWPDLASAHYSRKTQEFL